MEQTSTETPMEQTEPVTYTQESVEALQADWTRERGELEAALSEAKKTMGTQKIHYEFVAAAKERGFSEPAKLLDIINLSAITLDDDGQVSGLSELFDVLMLTKKSAQPRTIGGPVDPQSRTDPKEAQLKEAAERARSGNPSDMAAYAKLKRAFGGK
ncbi:hypothetical protein [Paenibacillus taiwanensis]|uniref:hypothetical protein n=1 Tax=Paenibacillus taiwanensis TaxID=401638 RepID=UPI0003F68D1D|nr:hypothetical protein [Paenibacillus taiwanensis]